MKIYIFLFRVKLRKWRQLSDREDLEVQKKKNHKIYFFFILVFLWTVYKYYLCSAQVEIKISE